MNFGREFFKIIDRSILAAILLKKTSQQLIEFLRTERVTQKLKDERAFAVHDVLVRRRLVVEIRRCTKKRCGLFERQRFFKQLATKIVELCTRQQTFAKRVRTELGESL